MQKRRVEEGGVRQPNACLDAIIEGIRGRDGWSARWCSGGCGGEGVAAYYGNASSANKSLPAGE